MTNFTECFWVNKSIILSIQENGMIVQKLWTTRKVGKWDEYLFNGNFFSTKESHWSGWFLFGIIPLYIKNIENIYSSKR